MLKYTFLLLLVTGTLFPKNLSENLKPVSENKNKYHVSKSNSKRTLSQNKYKGARKAGIVTGNSTGRLETDIHTKKDLKNLMIDYKKMIAKNPKIREAKKNKPIKSEKKAIERKRRRK